MIEFAEVPSVCVEDQSQVGCVRLSESAAVGYSKREVRCNQDQLTAYTLVSIRYSRQLALSGTVMTPYRRLSCALATEPERGRDRRPADAGRSQPIGLLLDLALQVVASFNEAVKSRGRAVRSPDGNRRRNRLDSTALTATRALTHRLPNADGGAVAALRACSWLRQPRGHGPRSRAGRSAPPAGSNGPCAASTRESSRR